MLGPNSIVVRRLLECGASVVCSMGLAAAQAPLWSVSSSQVNDRFGWSLDVTPDYTGDGLAEILIGAPWHDGSSFNAGAVHLYTGDGGWLLTNFGSLSGREMGTLVCFVGDTDADGATDWAMVDAFGRLEIASGLDGSILLAIDDLRPSSLDGVGDIDGDGRADFIVGIPSLDLARVYSGATFAVVYELSGESDSEFGSSVLGADDVTGDGVPDFAIASEGPPGIVRMLSGSDAQVVWQATKQIFTGGTQEPSLGVAGDHDEDGVPDIAVAWPWLGHLWILSGATGEELSSVEEDWPGPVQAGGGDIDGDRVPDLLVLAYPGPTVARIYSGANHRPLIEASGGLNPGFPGSARFLDDLDNDGTNEWIVGFPEPPPNTLASVQVFAGEPGVQCTAYGTSGHLSSLQYGTALVNAGDLDGDGFDELVIGEPYRDGNAANPDRGAFYVLSLESGLEIQQFKGTTNHQLLGYSAAPIDDLDGDDVPDYLIGGPSFVGSGLGGVVYCMSGATGTLIRALDGSTDESLFGWALADVGDIDEDSIHDLAVGEPDYALVYPAGGNLSIFSGATGVPIAAAEQTYLGTDHQFGRSVAGLGDVDGDGVPDYAVGAPGAGTTGQAGYCRLYSGADPSVILRTINGLGADDYFGVPVVNAGDRDGDGIDDLAVGAIHADPNGASSGQVRVLSSATGATLLTIDGQAAGERLGRSIAIVDDQDCDGVSDFLLGGDDQGPYPEGFARVVSGATGAEIATFRGLEPASEFGHAVASAGDVNGDGRDDLAIAAPEASWGFAEVGYVKVYTLNPSFVRPKAYCSAKESSLGCTPSIGYTGSPQTSGGCDDFYLHASGVIGQTDGFLLWGLAPNQHASPTGTFKGTKIGSQSPSLYGGLNCVAEPQRIGRQSSGGTAGQCDGAFTFHFDQSFMAANGLLAGETVYVQWWYSDPFHPDGTGVGHTDALRFTLKP